MRNLLSATVAMLFGYCGVACADLHYQGQFIIINASGGCDTFITNGLTANADYHPAFVDDAPPQKFKTSAMNVYYNILGLYGAHVMRIENRNFPHSPEGKFEKPNPFTETNVDWFDYKAAYPANLVVISERLEKTPGGFASLTMLGKVANIVGNDIEATCVITFEFTGVQSNQ